MAPELDLFRDVMGLSYKTSDGQLHRNPDGPVIADLDSLPWPAYHLFKMDRYTNLQPATDAIPGARSFSILTSRGCPYRCTFCSQSIMPIKWRARSAGERHRGMAAPGAGPGRAGDRRAGRQRQHPPEPAACNWPTT